MNLQRSIGAALLVCGVVLLVIGVNASHSIADQSTNLFTGHFTNATAWYIVGGIGAAILGFLLLLFGGGRKSI